MLSQTLLYYLLYDCRLCFTTYFTTAGFVRDVSASLSGGFCFATYFTTALLTPLRLQAWFATACLYFTLLYRSERLGSRSTRQPAFTCRLDSRQPAFALRYCTAVGGLVRDSLPLPAGLVRDSLPLLCATVPQPVLPHALLPAILGPTNLQALCVSRVRDCHHYLLYY